MLYLVHHIDCMESHTIAITTVLYISITHLFLNILKFSSEKCFICAALLCTESIVLHFYQ